MSDLLTRLQPYLEQQETEYPPGLCLAVALAAQAGVIGDAEKGAVLAAVGADQAATRWRTFKARTFRGTPEECIRQWREWAESLLQSVDK